MHIDVYIILKGSNVALHNINGLTYFKNNYSKYFRESYNIYIRWISTKTDHVGKWRILPNRSTDFYRCKSLPENYSSLVSQHWIKDYKPRSSFDLDSHIKFEYELTGVNND